MRYAIALLALCPCLAAATIFVDPAGGGDFIEIQPAIDFAEDGDVVMVSPGTYLINESIDFNRRHNPSDPTSPPVKNIALVSEAGPELTEIVMADPWKPNVSCERMSVVVFENGETSESILEGFTLRSGRGSLIPFPSASGAKVLAGGGILCKSGSSPTIRNCTIGPTDMWTSGSRCRDCGSERVCRDALGAGICSIDSAPLIDGCRILSNSSRTYGGGVFAAGSAAPRLVDCRIAGNEAKRGGGLSCEGEAAPCLDRCTLAGNRAEDGGGIHADGRSQPSLTACVLTANRATRGAAAFCDGDSSPSMDHTTIFANLAEEKRGAILASGHAVPIVASSIIWDNQGGSIVSVDEAHPDIRFSCVAGDSLWPGPGNIREDPRFCGWGIAADVYVDASRLDAGDGTPENPYPDLASALEFSLALYSLSPCRWAGEGGTDMGAETQTCDAPGSLARTVHLAAGRYPIAERHLIHGASLVGAGEDRTVIQGTIQGLRTGTTISSLTVTGGDRGGIRVPSGEAPEIRRVTIKGNMNPGIFCGPGSAPIIVDCTIAENRRSDVPAWETPMPDGGGVYISPGAAPSLTRCVIQDNFAWEDGGGIYVSGASPAITECVISGNRGRQGGGVYMTGVLSATLTGCAIEENYTGGSGAWAGEEGGRGGGLFTTSASPTIEACTIVKNRSREGGGLYSSGERAPILIDCEIAENQAGRIDGAVPGSGGGIYSASSAPRLIRAWIAENEATGQGGGAYVSGGFSPRFEDCQVLANRAAIGGGLSATRMGSPVVSACIIAQNSASQGGGISCAEEGVPVLTACRIEMNEAWEVGGGLLCGAGGGADISDCTIAENKAAHGAGVYCAAESSPIFQRCVLAKNMANESGGAMACVDGSIPALGHCSILLNSALDGGGIHAGSGAGVRLTGCRIGGNAAGSRGGGIVFCDSQTASQLENCVIEGNWAVGGGGGVHCSGAQVSFLNCVLSGNASKGASAIACASGPGPVFTHCTIAENVCLQGTAWLSCQENARPEFKNCIAWQEGGTPACGWFPSCLTEKDPLFVRAGVYDFARFRTIEIDGSQRTLPDFIVQEADLHLRAGSPAIDTVQCVGVATDMDGKKRPIGAHCDIGAYEYEGPRRPRFVRGDVNADAQLDLADAIASLNHQFGGGPAPTCLKTADINADGVLDLGDPISLLTYLFAQGSGPAPPHPECGADPNGGGLACERYAPCE